MTINIISRTVLCCWICAAALHRLWLLPLSPFESELSRSSHQATSPCSIEHELQQHIIPALPVHLPSATHSSFFILHSKIFMIITCPHSCPLYVRKAPHIRNPRSVSQRFSNSCQFTPHCASQKFSNSLILDKKDLRNQFKICVISVVTSYLSPLNDTLTLWHFWGWWWVCEFVSSDDLPTADQRTPWSRWWGSHSDSDLIRQFVVSACLRYPHAF